MVASFTRTLMTGVISFLICTTIGAQSASSDPDRTVPSEPIAHSGTGGPIVGDCPARALPPDGGTAEDLEGRYESEWRLFTYPTGRMPEGDWRGRAMDYVEHAMVEAAPAGLETFNALPGRGEAVITPGTTWTALGPVSLNSLGTSTGYQYGTVGGRFNTVVFNGTSNSTTAYAASPVGGVWKTTDCCSATTSWTPLWNDPNFAAQSVTALAVDHNIRLGTDIIYAGTGDSESGLGDMYGSGVFKSTNSGASWTQHGADVFAPYASAGVPAAACCAQAPNENIEAIAVDPRDASTVFAGASYGLFVSYDAGVTWAQVDVVDRNSPTYDNCAQKVTSILIDGSTNPSTLYVAIGYPYQHIARPGVNGGANGVYKATVPTSGAPVFTLKNSGWPAGTGSGTPNTVGRIELAFNAAQTRIYAQVSNSNPTLGALGTYTTANGGSSWTLLSGSGQAAYDDCAADATNEKQDWYDLFVGVDPLDDKTLYIGRTSLYKAIVNAGYTGFSSVTNLGDVYTKTCPAYSTVHPDQHGIDFKPGSNPSVFVVANDGGLFRGDGSVGGFIDMNTDVDNFQLYAGQLGRDFANTSGTTTQMVMGGFQDNGEATWDSSQSTLRWIARSVGGDGFYTAFDPIAGSRTAGRFISEYSYGTLYCSSAGAAGTFTDCAPTYATNETPAWSTPFILDQWNCNSTNCENMFLGAGGGYASTDAGVTWSRVRSSFFGKSSSDPVIAVNVSHSSPGSVLVGTGQGNMYWSDDVFTGTNCTAAKANTSTFNCTPNTAATWVNLTDGNAVLPNRAISGVAFSPNYSTAFYAAVGGFDTNTPTTPGHIFYGGCASAPCTATNFGWFDRTGNLPDIPFESIEINPNNIAQAFAGSVLGFYYTDNILVSQPVWKRFQTGMPNTRVRFLALDRGPATAPKASTTLGAFTFGRGLYVTRLSPSLAGCTAPLPPTLLSATGTCSGVELAWAEPANAVSYNIYRNSACGGIYFKVAGPVLGTTYTDTSAVAGTTYAYTVSAGCDADGIPDSSVSNCISAASLSVPAASSAPTFSALTCTTVTVSWTLITDATGYEVWRKSGACGSGAVKVSGASPVTGTSFDDSGLTGSLQYSYYVVARNSCGPSANGACASVTTLTPPLAPNAPTFTGVDCTTLTVNWNAVSGATGYAVYRAPGQPACGTGSVKISGTPTGTSFTDNTVSASSQYTYYIVATSGPSCLSVARNCATVTTNPCQVPPETAPGGLASTAQTWTDKATHSWPSNPTATSYVLHRGIQQDLPGLTGTATDGCTRFQGTGLTASGLSEDPGNDPLFPPSNVVPGRFYWYLVVGVNQTGPGSAGNATAGPRVVNSNGSCP
jgi:hypothetical protein